MKTGNRCDVPGQRQNRGAVTANVLQGCSRRRSLIQLPPRRSENDNRRQHAEHTTPAEASSSEKVGSAEAYRSRRKEVQWGRWYDRPKGNSADQSCCRPCTEGQSWPGKCRSERRASFQCSSMCRAAGIVLTDSGAAVCFRVSGEHGFRSLDKGLLLVKVVQDRLQLVHEVIDVLKFTIHRCESYKGHFVQVTQCAED